MKSLLIPTIYFVFLLFGIYVAKKNKHSLDMMLVVIGMTVYSFVRDLHIELFYPYTFLEFILFVGIFFAIGYVRNKVNKK